MKQFQTMVIVLFSGIFISFLGGSTVIAEETILDESLVDRDSQAVSEPKSTELNRLGTIVWELDESSVVRPLALTNPIIVFDEVEFDFGIVGQQLDLTHQFTFTNVGQRDLEIQGVKDCCRSLSGFAENMIVKPGEQGTVTLTLQTANKVGRVRERFYVLSNDPTEPGAHLELSADITAPVMIVPFNFGFGICYATYFKQTGTVTRYAKILAQDKEQLKIMKIQSSNPLISARVVPLVDQNPNQKKQKKSDKPSMLSQSELVKSCNLVIECSLKAGVGELHEELVIYTNNTEVPEIRIPVQASFHSDIETDARGRFWIQKPAHEQQRVEKGLVVFTDAPIEFSILKVLASDPLFTSEVKTIKPGKRYVVEVALTQSATEISSEPKLTIFVDHPDQPTIVVPIYVH